jgi:hypothetical protein
MPPFGIQPPEPGQKESQASERLPLIRGY